MSDGKKFQIQLSGNWQDYSHDEDKILKRAYMAGFPQCKFSLRGQNYEYHFGTDKGRMRQINLGTGKSRPIRAPRGWKAPSVPLVPKGETTVVNVPRGGPGTEIMVPYPGQPGKFIKVNVPASAKVGQAMLVPVPPVSQAATQEASSGSGRSGGDGWSTGAKVAAGGAAVVAVGGAAVGGAILGEHIAEHGVDATVEAAGDGLADAGEAIGDFVVDAGEFIVDAAEDAGDFIMDLF